MLNFPGPMCCNWHRLVDLYAFSSEMAYRHAFHGNFRKGRTAIHSHLLKRIAKYVATFVNSHFDEWLQQEPEQWVLANPRFFSRNVMTCRLGSSSGRTRIRQP